MATDEGIPGQRYIHIHNWDDFQHYRYRGPAWIKDYTEQLRDSDYTNLTYHQRGVLQGLRLLYAILQKDPTGKRQSSDNSSTGHRGISDSTSYLYSQLGQRVLTRDLKALNHAGLIDFSASKVLAPCPESASTRVREQRTELEREKTTPPTPSIEPALVVVLEPISEQAFLILAAVDKPGYDESKFTRARFAVLVAAHPVANLVGEAEALADFETYGKGARKPLEPKDGISRLRNWLKKAAPPHLTVVPDEPYVVGGGIYPPYDPKIHPFNPDFVDPFALPGKGA